MIKLLHQLSALYNFYKSAHWLAKGEYFYQDHLLFGKLYEGLDDEMDTLVELMLGLGSDDSEFDAKKLAEESGKITPKTGKDCISNLKTASTLEEGILKTIEAFNEKKVPVGLFNHLAAIAESHTRNGYLIERSLRVESEK
jgi:DNA-binding ferritin-like protein